jgi:hypothetical protein
LILILINKKAMAISLKAISFGGGEEKEKISRSRLPG